MLSFAEHSIAMIGGGLIGIAFAIWFGLPGLLLALPIAFMFGMGVSALFSFA